MSINLTCGRRCVEPGWEHLRQQAIYGAVGAAGLAGAGLLANILAPRATANSRGIVSIFECGLASFTPGCAFALTLAHFCQCIIWSIRCFTNTVDAVYYAVEMIFTLLIFLDVLAVWIFVVANGPLAILKSALSGRFMLDCLVVTSVVAMSARDEDGGRTWFSFAFLAAVRQLRVLAFVQRGDAFSSNSSWRRQVLYHILLMVLFVFASAASVMILERLGTPSSVQEPPWDLSAGASFAFSTMFTLGDNAFCPRTVLGRVFAVCLLCWAVLNLFTRILPLMLRQLLGKGVGNGSYRRRRFTQTPHVVIFGTPTGPMLWDFMQEIYHSNHFNGMIDFDRKAPDVVVLLPSERTFAHFQRYLGRQEALLFRDRVIPLLGDAFNPEDLKRVKLHQARRAIVLPDLTSADAAASDHSNIMRMFAITGAAPEVPALCLLNSSVNIPVSRYNSSFLSIDSFKLSLLAVACITPGALTFVSNLCKTVAASTKAGRPWQLDYENGLGSELYEVPLSNAYHDATFSQIFEDVMARSKNADVYLLGVVERSGDSDGKVVRINPGADTRISCLNDLTSGIFVAPDVGAVLQCQTGEDLLGISTEESSRSGSPVGAKSLSRAPSTATLRKAATSDILPSSPGGGLPGVPMLTTLEEDIAKAQEQERAVRHKQWEHELAEKGYQKSMAWVQQRLLVKGFGISVVAEVANKLQEGARMKDWDSGVGAVLPKSAPTSPASADKGPGAVDLAAVAAAVGVTSEEEKQVSFSRNAQVQQLERKAQEIGHLHALFDRVAREAVNLPVPPPVVIQNGGHLLVCVVDDASSGTDGGVTPGLGPELGIGHFLRPLRNERLQAAELRPSVVVLAEALPGDWHVVAEAERVFFLKGSAHCLEDLNAAGFRKARSIAVIRGRRSAHFSHFKTKVADSRVVLAASLIEKNLPNDSNTPVITDHAYCGSCNFLPVNSLAAYEALPATPACNVGQVPDVSKMLAVITGMVGLAPSGKVASLTPQPRIMDGGSGEEDYEGLEFTDYLHHPRFMRGQVFVSSVITGLAAGTVYNPSLVLLVSELLKAPMLLLPVTQGWERKSYGDFASWLLRTKNLLAVGIYRSSTAADTGAFGRIDLSAPTHFYTYSAPPGQKTLMIRSDRVLCILPSGS